MKYDKFYLQGWFYIISLSSSKLTYCVFACAMDQKHKRILSAEEKKTSKK